MTELQPGESLNLNKNDEGGPVFTRDEHGDGAYHIAEHGGELYRDEIRRLAEAAGFEVFAE